MNTRVVPRIVAKGSPEHRVWQLLGYGSIAVLVLVIATSQPDYRMLQFSAVVAWSVALLGMNLIIGYADVNNKGTANKLVAVAQTSPGTTSIQGNVGIAATNAFLAAQQADFWTVSNDGTGNKSRDISGSDTTVVDLGAKDVLEPA